MAGCSNSTIALVIIMCFRIAVFGVVYYFYVIFRNQLSSDYLIALEASIAIFDIVYEKVFVLMSIDYVYNKSKVPPSQITVAYLSLRLILHIVVPAIMTVLFDSLCFENLYFSRNEIPTSYEAYFCYSFDDKGHCDVGGVQTFNTTAIAPFVYSHQCKNAIITYQAPIVIFSAIIYAFVIPAISCFLIKFPSEKVNRTINICTLKFQIPLLDPIFWSNEPPSALYPIRLIVDNALQLCYLFVYGLLEPFVAFAVGVSIFSVNYFQLSIICRHLHALESRFNIDSECNSVHPSDTFSGVNPMINTTKVHSVVIDAPFTVTGLVSLILPNESISVTNVSNSELDTKESKIFDRERSKIALSATDDSDKRDYSNKTQEDIAKILQTIFSNANECILASLGPVVLISTLFLMFVFVDMAWDRAPFVDCIWILVSMIFIPFVFYIQIYRLLPINLLFDSRDRRNDRGENNIIFR